MEEKNHWLKIETLRLKLSEWGFTKEGFKNNRRGEWLLLIQLLIIAAHLLPSWPRLYNWPNLIKIIAISLIMIGSYKSYLSLKSLGSSLSPLPEPKINAQLKTNGSYQYCRHPLYQSLTFISLGVVLFSGSFLHLILFILLSFTLINKAKREESKLRILHIEYEDYIQKTPAILKGLIFYDWRN